MQILVNSGNFLRFLEAVFKHCLGLNGLNQLLKTAPMFVKSLKQQAVPSEVKTGLLEL